MKILHSFFLHLISVCSIWGSDFVDSTFVEEVLWENVSQGDRVPDINLGCYHLFLELIVVLTVQFTCWCLLPTDILFVLCSSKRKWMNVTKCSLESFHDLLSQLLSNAMAYELIIWPLTLENIRKGSCQCGLRRVTKPAPAFYVAPL